MERELKARSLRLGKKGRCIGVVIVEEVFAEKGSSVQELYASKVVFEEMMSAQRVYANEVQLGDGCRIEELYYTTTLKENGRVHYAKPPTRLGKIPEPPWG